MKPCITPELVTRFAHYFAKEPAWGPLHIVLDEPNYKDDDVAFCIKRAQHMGDGEGMALAEILMSMSKTQRSKIGGMAERRWADLGLGHGGYSAFFTHRP